jgi:hypothetical protein
VAAILNFFLPIPHIEADDPESAHWWWLIGGIAQGGFQRFETPLAGGAAASMRASGVGWRAACAARGEPSRPTLSPGGNGKRGIRFLAAAGSSRLLRGAAGLVCARSSTTVLLLRSHHEHIPILSISFPELWPSPPSPTPLPCFYPHSEWAANGPVQVGVRSPSACHISVRRAEARAAGHRTLPHRSAVRCEVSHRHVINHPLAQGRDLAGGGME